LIRAADLPASLLETVEATFRESMRRKNDLDAMDQPYIFVYTGFRRKNEPIFVLAFMEGRRNIIIPKKDVLSDSGEELARVCALVQNHYAVQQGKLPVWGTIQSYVYHPDAQTHIIIGPDGVVRHPDTPVCESRATLSLG